MSNMSTLIRSPRFGWALAFFLIIGTALYAQTAPQPTAPGPEKPINQNQTLTPQLLSNPQSQYQKVQTQQAQSQQAQSPQVQQVQAQPTLPAAQPQIQRPRMTVLGIFDAGQPGAGIFKMFDPTDQVLCYVLMPETAGRKNVGNTWVYDGNSVGSISCVKVDLTSKKDDNNTAASDQKNRKLK